MPKNQQNSITMISPQEIERLKKIPGQVRGAVILANLEYLEKKFDKNIQEKIAEKLKEWKIDLPLDSIEPMKMYPEYFSVALILAAGEILKFQEKDYFEMGKGALKLSFFIKLLIKFFGSVQKCFREISNYWKRHFDFGEMEAVELNVKQKYAIIRIKGYRFHPLMCHYHRGYFAQAAELILGRPSVQITETRCVFNGDLYHEYLIKWS